MQRATASFAVWRSTAPCLATSGESTVYRRLYWPHANETHDASEETREEHLQVLDGGDPSESFTRNSLNLILTQVPGEREMRKRKREILGFVWSHFTFRVLRKMDGSLDLWSLRPNCSTDHKCHILLYSSGLLSLCLCVRLMKNISKAVLCNERSHSGMSHNPAEN